MNGSSVRRWLLAPLTLALTLALAALVLPWISAADTPRPLGYGAALLYAACAVAALAGLCWRGGSALLGRRRAERMRPNALRAPLLGRPLWAWLVAAGVCAAAAALLVGRLFDDGRQAAWVRLALDADPAAPPAAALRYDGGSVPFQWQPYAESMVAVRPAQGAATPLRIAAIETERGPLPLDQVTARDGALDEQGLLLPNPQGALLNWAQPSRAVTLTLAAGQGAAEMLWFDQRAIAQLGPEPTTAALRLPGVWQGWALLPAEPTGQLALELPPAAAPYVIRQLELLGGAPQTWLGANAAGALTGEGCTTQPLATGVQVGASAACVVHAPLARPLNEARPIWWLARWLGLTLALLALLALLTAALNALERLIARVPVALAAREAQGARPPAVGRTMLAVWLLASAWHLLYALAVPLAYTNDSLNYYDFAQQLLAGLRFPQIGSERTPGYPAFIALVIGLFGHSALWIAVIQHLALALLAPLVVWALWRRVPLLVAALAGLLAGCSPATSVMANVPHTEALFAACVAVALLLYTRYGERLRPMLGVGLLLGVATMLRPAAVLLLAVWLGWLLLWGWAARRPWAALVCCAALVVGHTAIAGPWQLHLLLQRHTLDISDGRAGFTAWDAGVTQRRVRADLAAMQPDRAVWQLWQAWAYSPHLLLARYPALITGIGDMRRNQPFYAASVREADRASVDRLRESQRLALIYNLTLKWRGGETYFHWTDMSYFLDAWRTPDQTPPPSASDDALLEMMPMLVYRWHPQRSPLRTALIDTSKLALRFWWVLAGLALASALPLLAHPTHYRLLAGWLYWLALVAAGTVLGMPVDRYVIVVEPLLYILAAAGLGVLLDIRQRQPALRTSAHPPQKAAAPATTLQRIEQHGTSNDR